MPATLTSSTRSTALPTHSCTTPQGVVEFANGLNPANRWDGLTAALETAGIPQAGSGMSAADGGAGNIPEGTYYYAVRFIDDESQPGSLQATLTSITLVGANSDVDLTSIPTSSDARVTAREIYRSTLGQSSVFYKITTLNDNVTTTYTDNATDATIQALPELPISWPDGTVRARRFGQPPSYCRAVLQHDEFTIYGVPAFYKYGHAEMTNGSATVTIVGGVPTTAMIGRLFSVTGHATEYTISNVSGQTVTLSSNYTGSTDLFASYSIYPAKSTWRALYPSYIGEPESINSDDAWVVMADASHDPTLTGFYSFNSFVFVTTANHTFRWTFTESPAKDGAMFPALDRGMLNPKCVCRADNIVGVLDRNGVYLTSGGNVNTVSEPIQDFFRSGIVWERKDWFHAIALPEEETMFFFVCLDGSRYPKHALCLNYMTGEWWVIELPWETPSACVVPFAGRKRLVLGSEHERFSVYGETVTDGLPSGAAAPGRFEVTSATPISVTISGSNWRADADIVGVNVSIISGRGRGQTRRIIAASKASGRIDVHHEWSVRPDDTSVVVIAGIPWLWQSDMLTMTPNHPGEKKVEVTIDPTENDANVAISLYLNNRTTPHPAERDTTSSKSGMLARGDTAMVFNVKQFQGDDNDQEHDGIVGRGMDDGFNTDNHGEVKFVAVEVSGVTEQDPIVMQDLFVAGAG